LDGEEGAVLDFARGIGAGVDGVLEEGFIPAHDEVAVVAVAGWITVGDDEFTFLVLECVGVENGLLEQRR